MNQTDTAARIEIIKKRLQAISRIISATTSEGAAISFIGRQGIKLVNEVILFDAQDCPTEIIDALNAYGNRLAAEMLILETELKKTA